MTSVVIDTNVVVSGIFWGGPPGHLLKAVNQGAIKQYATPEIVEEYEEISQRLGLKLKVDYRSALDLILRNLILVAPAKLKNQVCEDADDDIFIKCALAARANFIISGDKLLLKVVLPKIEIVTVSSFLRKFLDS